MTVTIAPNDANLLYSPFNWDRTASRAQTVNSGASLKAALTGAPSSLTMRFDVSNVGDYLPQVAWRIDGGPWQHAPIAATIPVAIPTDDQWPVRTLEMVVKSTSGAGSRWSSPWPNGVKFTGLTASDGTATAPVRRRPLTGIVFGDSITEGLRSLGVFGGDSVDDSSATVAWAWLLGEALGAEVGVCGFAGQGWTTPGSGFVPPFPDTWRSLFDQAARPAVDPGPPDFIVLNHGTNDQTDPSAVATATITAILATYSTAKVVYLGTVSGKWDAELAAVVAALGSQRVTFVPSSGWLSPGDFVDGTHPYGYSSITTIAPRLAAAVRGAVASGGNRYIKSPSGSLVAY